MINYCDDHNILGELLLSDENTVAILLLRPDRRFRGPLHRSLRQRPLGHVLRGIQQTLDLFRTGSLHISRRFRRKSLTLMNRAIFFF